ncbi:MAG: deoxyribonuclease IV [Chloroflexota bacterium]
MSRTVARREPRRRLTWPAGSPRVGIHLGVAAGLLKAARRARQIGAAALQIFSDNPTAWRRRPEPPAEAAAFIAYCAAAGISPVAIHASYLINLAGRAEPFGSQSLAGLIHEVQRAPAYGATLVNTHMGSHRGEGIEAGRNRLAGRVASVLAETPQGVRLVLENSSGGGATLGSTIEDLAQVLEAVAGPTDALAFCLDTAHLWGAGYDISTTDGALAVVDRFEELIGLDRLALVHLNDSRSILGSRGDRHQHLGAGQIGSAGLSALLRDRRLSGGATFVMETPGTDQGYDAVNVRRARLLLDGVLELPALSAQALQARRAIARVRRPG